MKNFVAVLKGKLESLRLSYAITSDREECAIIRAQMEVIECIIEAAEAEDE